MDSCYWVILFLESEFRLIVGNFRKLNCWVMKFGSVNVKENGKCGVVMNVRSYYRFVILILLL